MCKVYLLHCTIFNVVEFDPVSPAEIAACLAC